MSIQEVAREIQEIDISNLTLKIQLLEQEVKNLRQLVEGLIKAKKAEAERWPKYHCGHPVIPGERSCGAC